MLIQPVIQIVVHSTYFWYTYSFDLSFPSMHTLNFILHILSIHLVSFRVFAVYALYQWTVKHYKFCICSVYIKFHFVCFKNTYCFVQWIISVNFLLVYSEMHPNESGYPKLKNFLSTTFKRMLLQKFMCGWAIGPKTNQEQNFLLLYFLIPVLKICMMKFKFDYLCKINIMSKTI